MNRTIDCRSIAPLAVAITMCGMLPAALAQENPSVTYNGEAGRIINENCVVCHREGGIGPMQFETYEQVRPWAPLIQFKVANREMPPYAYDHGIGIQELQGDWRMAQEDIDALVAWVDQGALLGDPDSPPSPPDLKDPTEWNFVDQFGEPDIVVRSVPIDVPANGNDMWHQHYVNSGMTEDRCVRAVQVKPRGDAQSVVHHANAAAYSLDENGELERQGMLTEYAMGKWGEIVPEGVCRKFGADTVVQWDVHMFPGGLGSIAPDSVIEDNQVELGLWLHPADYDQQSVFPQELHTFDIQYTRDNRREHLVIPPHGKLITQGYKSFDHPVRIDSFQPHGHLRMVAASAEIYYPETDELVPISQISNWSATWHHSHIFEPHVAPLMPTGAVLIMRQWYDNTVDNPNNPDADQWVYGGDRTTDEMSHAWVAVTHLDEEGYERLVAERESQSDHSGAGLD